MISVSRLDGKRLLGRAGRHEIVTDRKIEDGGSDSGCSSGELLLIAIGSCVMGSVRNFLGQHHLQSSPLEVNVSLETNAENGSRDTIAVLVTVPSAIPGDQIEAIRTASTSGGVVSRMLLGSTVNVEVSCHGCSKA